MTRENGGACRPEFLLDTLIPHSRLYFSKAEFVLDLQDDLIQEGMLYVQGAFFA